MIVGAKMAPEPQKNSESVRADAFWLIVKLKQNQLRLWNRFMVKGVDPCKWKCFTRFCHYIITPSYSIYQQFMRPWEEWPVGIYALSYACKHPKRNTLLHFSCYYGGFTLANGYTS